MKRLLRKLNRMEARLNRDVDRMLRDRNLNRVITPVEIGKNYRDMLQEARRLGKWRKRVRRLKKH